jgi:hypothetical protein
MYYGLKKILSEILVDATTSRSHLISLFDLGGGIFHFQTPLTASVARKVQETSNINEVTCTCSK